MASKKVVAKPVLKSSKSSSSSRAAKTGFALPEITEVREAAQKLWQAGVGAVTIAQKNVGEVVSTLKSEGGKIYQKTSTLLDGTLGDVRKQVEGVVSQVQGTVNANLSWVEEKVSEGVGSVLGRLGVPSKADIQDLSQRVAELSKQVKALQVAKVKKAA